MENELSIIENAAKQAKQQIDFFTEHAKEIKVIILTSMILEIVMKKLKKGVQLSNKQNQQIIILCYKAAKKCLGVM